MEKLLELMNERTHTKWGYEEIIEGNYAFFDDTLANPPIIDVILVCSKYGFIKWLVDNDKINFKKVPKINNTTPMENVTMWLSIQVNPIEILISILK